MASAPGAVRYSVTVGGAYLSCVTFIIHKTTTITIDVIQDRHAHHVSIPVMKPYDDDEGDDVTVTDSLALLNFSG